MCAVGVSQNQEGALTCVSIGELSADQRFQRVDTAAGHIVRHDVLGGLIHEYERVAA